MVRPGYDAGDSSSGSGSSKGLWPGNASGSNVVSLLWVLARDTSTLSHTQVNSVVQDPGGGDEASYTKLIDVTYSGVDEYRLTCWYLLDAAFVNGVEHVATMNDVCDDILLVWAAIEDAKQEAPTDYASYSHNDTVATWSNDLVVQTDNALVVDCMMSDPKSWGWTAKSGQTKRIDNTSRAFAGEMSTESADTETASLGWDFNGGTPLSIDQLHGLVAIWEIGASPAADNTNAAFAGFNS